jgi:hypothetical protein
MYKFANIDIADSKQANGYAHYLVALQNLEPICLDMPISKDQQPLIDEMKRLCAQIEAFLPECEPCHLREYAVNYALLYPFAKLKPVDAKMLDSIDFSILDAWMDGDDRISEIEAYGIVGRHLAEVPSDLRSWYQRKQAEYFLAIDENGKFAHLSVAENYRVLNGLWNDSIWERFPDCTYSKGDVAAINYAEDFKAFDTATLCEYYRFHRLYSPASARKTQHSAAILDELSRRLDLTALSRQAYALDKQFLLLPA